MPIKELQEMFSDKIVVDVETDEIVVEEKDNSLQQTNIEEDKVLNNTETKSNSQESIISDIQEDKIIVDDEEDIDENSDTNLVNKDEDISITKDDSKNLDSEADDDSFVEVVKDLHEEFFPDATEDEIKDIKGWEGVKKLMATQFTAEIETAKKTLRTDALNTLIKEGYVDKSQVKREVNIINFEKTKIKDDIELQKDIIRASYKRKGLEDSDIETLIKGEIDLEERAAKEYETLINIDKSNREKESALLVKEEEDRKKQNEEFAESFKKEIKGLNTLLPNKNLDDKKQNELFLNINNTFNKINSNQAKYYAMLSYLDNLGVLDGKFDDLLKTGETIGTNKMEAILRAKKTSSGSKKTQRKEEDYILTNSDIPNIYS